MELHTHLDQDKFSWLGQAGGRAFALVDVKAPKVVRVGDPSPTNLVAVLDRSGSMGGDRIAEAKRALCSVVDRLGPADSFGLVTFDDRVDIIVPAAPVTDRSRIKWLINGVDARGTTDLAAGLVQGLVEARRLESPSGVRVLLISDGHANHGITDPELLASYAAKFASDRITTSTLGMGLGYDERILSAIAREGSGNEHFAENADSASAQIAQECWELMDQAFLGCRLTVRLATGATKVTLRNDLPYERTSDGLEINLGGFQSEELRQLVLQFRPATATRPGRRKLATIQLAYVGAGDLVEHIVTHSVWTEIAAANSAPPVVNWEVRGEAAFQRAQARKRSAMKYLAIGDIERAQRRMAEARRILDEVKDHLPLDRQLEAGREIDELRGFEVDAAMDSVRTSKILSVNTAFRSRSRGRQ